MKTYITVSFNEGRKRYAEVRRVLDSIGCTGQLRGLEHACAGLFHKTFASGDPELAALRSALDKAQITRTETVERIYDDAELRGFALLRLVLRRPLVDGGGARFGTRYDTSAGCPNCGTGALQASPLILSGSGLPKNSLICQTFYGQFLVAKELADVLRHAQVSGLELRQVRDLRSQRPLPWWQIISSCTMPRTMKGMLRDSSPGWGCTICNRDMWCPKELEEITYSRCEIDPAGVPDFAQTWECYGRSLLHDDPERELVRGFAQPLLLVSVKVFDVLKKLKVKQAEFEPVRFE